ncbi:hypothetical protein HWV62_12080 [Athelia sp. TMB]|nr:hypothetical protein HWV62_12080 [Athelia sp. TMB]
MKANVNSSSASANTPEQCPTAESPSVRPEPSISFTKTMSTEPTVTSEPAMSTKSSSQIKPKGRNLVVCIDGTSNTYGEKWTNVLELYSRLESDKTQQLRYYQNGIGTGDNSSLGNALDLAFARHIGTGIKQAYRWLSERYEPGDRIFLFGFSRGAYQVGLVQSGHEEHIPLAYKLYMRNKTERSTDAKLSELVNTFKHKLSSPIRVHFVGIWDTVSSIGIMRGKAGALINCENHACFVRHALALDERRVKFMPECILQDHQEILHVKEVWFSGTHSDVGGVHSLSENNAELKNASLSWMENESISAGLLFKPSSNEWVHSDLLDNSPRVSLKHIWWIVEYLPILRSTRGRPTDTTRRIHRGQGRVIYPTQKVHASVVFTDPQYEPRASFARATAQPGPWENFLARGKVDLLGGSILWHERIEMDLFDMSSASGLVQALGDRHISPFMVNHVLRHLEYMASLCGGQQAIAVVPKVKETLEKLVQSLEQVSAAQGTNSAVKGQHFLATLRLLAKLASAHTFTASTKSARQLQELSEWAREQISSTEVLGALFKHFDPMKVDLVDQFASNTLEDNWEHWAQTITAMAALAENAAVKSLVEVLPDSGGAAAASVLALLSENTEDSDPRFDLQVQEAILESPQYRTLKKRHRSGEFGATNAAATLNALAFSGETPADSKMVFTSVQKLSDSLKNQIYGPAASRLAALASQPGKRKEMIQNETVKALIVRLEMHDPDLAVQALQKLLDYDDTLEAVIAHMKDLFAVIRGFHPGPAGKVLLSLAEHAGAKSQFVPFLGSLIEMLSGANAALAVSLISKLAGHDDIRPSIDYDSIVATLLGNVMRSEIADDALLGDMMRSEIVDDAAGVLEALILIGDVDSSLSRFFVGLARRFLHMLSHFENSTCHINLGAEPSQGAVTGPEVNEVMMQLEIVCFNNHV